jgi:hypothetical protein
VDSQPCLPREIVSAIAVLVDRGGISAQDRRLGNGGTARLPTMNK